MHWSIECIDSVGNGWLNMVPSKSYILVCQGVSGSGDVCKVCLSLTIVNCSSLLIHPQLLLNAYRTLWWLVLLFNKNLKKKTKCTLKNFFQMFSFWDTATSFYSSSAIRSHVQLEQELVKNNNFLPLNILLSMY